MMYNFIAENSGKTAQVYQDFNKNNHINGGRNKGKIGCSF